MIRSSALALLLMKRSMTFLAIAATIGSQGLSLDARAGSDAGPGRHAHKLELELTSMEYERLLQSEPDALADADAKALKPVLDLGKRNLDLLKAVNQARKESEQISLSSKETQQGHPVEKPRVYNVSIILKNFQALSAQVPAPLMQALAGNGPLGPTLPISDADYVKWGLQIDFAYQIAMRWLTLKPYRLEYIAARKDDIRGYYFLSREEGLEGKLAAWSSLDAATQARLRGHLVGLCGNSYPLKQCAEALDRVIASKGDVAKFHGRYVGAGRALHDGLFKIRWPRKDLVWTSADPLVLHAPFVDPRDARVSSYLKSNIEDEWQWDGWRLSLEFQPNNAGSTSHLIFKPGTTPHALIEKSAIVMDANQPITEYDSQWTIRHEYGHLLGFPDCYVEFYETESEAMVSYQLDITNLMCSRRGDLQQKHFDEMKSAYFKAAQP
jgi:hypothetical protein